MEGHSIKMEVSDIELIDKIKQEGDNNSLIELSRRHTPLCSDIYKKYSLYISASGNYLPDVIGEKDSVIYKAALSFNPTKGAKFSTWLGNNIRFQCLDAINVKHKSISVESETLNYIFDSIEAEKEQSQEENIDYVFSLLRQIKDKRILRIFEIRYLENQSKIISWAEISKIIGVSTQTAINLHKRGLKILKSKMKSCKFFDEI